MRRLVWLVAAAWLAVAAPAGALQKGDLAPAFSLPSTSGKLVSLADLSGSVVAISFWATWGRQCAEELQYLQDLHEEFGEGGLVVLALNEREETSQALGFFEKHEVTHEVLLDDGTVARAFGVNGVPDLWILDREGIVRARFIGYGPTVPEGIRTAVAAAIASPAETAGRGATGAGEAPSVPGPLRAYAHLQLGAAHVNIGDAFVKAGFRDAGHFNQALTEFRAGLALDPRNVQLHIWLGLVWERRNDRAGAIREYHTALALDGSNVYAQDALRRLGVPWTPPPPPQEADE